MLIKRSPNGIDLPFSSEITPHEVYERPCTRFVADFIGIANILPIDGGQSVQHGLTLFKE